MNIKSVSDLLGISADTIRYYERVGLVPPITRTATGIRDFQDQDIEALEFIKSVLAFVVRTSGVTVIQKSKKDIEIAVMRLSELSKKLVRTLLQ